VCSTSATSRSAGTSSLEKLIEDSKETYYDTLGARAPSAVGDLSARESSVIKISLSNELTVGDLRNASPGPSDSYIRRILIDLNEHGVMERVGAGRGSKWLRLRLHLSYFGRCSPAPPRG